MSDERSFNQPEPRQAQNAPTSSNITNEAQRPPRIPQNDSYSYPHQPHQDFPPGTHSRRPFVADQPANDGYFPPLGPGDRYYRDHWDQGRSNERYYNNYYGSPTMGEPAGGHPGALRDVNRSGSYAFVGKYADGDMDYSRRQTTGYSDGGMRGIYGREEWDYGQTRGDSYWGYGGGGNDQWYGVNQGGQGMTSRRGFYDERYDSSDKIPYVNSLSNQSERERHGMMSDRPQMSMNFQDKMKDSTGSSDRYHLGDLANGRQMPVMKPNDSKENSRVGASYERKSSVSSTSPVDKKGQSSSIKKAETTLSAYESTVSLNSDASKSKSGKKRKLEPSAEEHGAKKPPVRRGSSSTDKSVTAPKKAGKEDKKIAEKTVNTRKKLKINSSPEYTDNKTAFDLLASLLLSDIERQSKQMLQKTASVICAAKLNALHTRKSGITSAQGETADAPSPREEYVISEQDSSVLFGMCLSHMQKVSQDYSINVHKFFAKGKSEIPHELDVESNFERYSKPKKCMDRLSTFYTGKVKHKINKNVKFVRGRDALGFLGETGVVDMSEKFPNQFMILMDTAAKRSLFNAGFIEDPFSRHILIYEPLLQELVKEKYPSLMTRYSQLIKFSLPNELIQRIDAYRDSKKADPKLKYSDKDYEVQSWKISPTIIQ